MHERNFILFTKMFLNGRTFACLVTYAQAAQPHLHPRRAHGQCRTALFAAATKGSKESVEVLLAAKANPNLYSSKVGKRKRTRKFCCSSV